MRKLVYLTIFLVFALSSVYIISPKITLPRLSCTLLFFYLFTYFAVSRSTLKLKKTTNQVVFWVFILVGYRAANDFFLHNMSSIETLYEILKQTFPVFLLVAIEYLEIEDKKIIITIFFASFIQISFGFIQLYNPAITINQLITQIPYLRGSELTYPYILQTSRISGTEIISVGYALLLGIFVIIAIAEYLRNRTQIYLIALYLFLCGVLILFTETRSAIYGIIPSIVIACFICSNPGLKRILFYSTIVISIIASFNLIESGITNIKPRAKFAIRGNTYQKLAANIYGSYAALMINPLFGVPRSKHLSIIHQGAQELGEIIPSKRNYPLIETHHNLFGLYIKFYGLLGLFILLVLLSKIFKKIRLKSDRSIKVMLYGVFIYFLQYAMLHNNMLLYFFPIWILLALGLENVEEKSIKLRH